MEKGLLNQDPKPIYATLVWQENATHHFLVVSGDGGKALFEIVSTMCTQTSHHHFLFSRKTLQVKNTLIPCKKMTR